MMYTRRHFEDVAKTISKITPLAARKTEANKWAKKFKADNPRFDRKRFMDACEVK